MVSTVFLFVEITTSKGTIDLSEMISSVNHFFNLESDNTFNITIPSSFQNTLKQELADMKRGDKVRYKYGYNGVEATELRVSVVKDITISGDVGTSSYMIKCTDIGNQTRKKSSTNSLSKGYSILTALGNFAKINSLNFETYGTITDTFIDKPIQQTTEQTDFDFYSNIVAMYYGSGYYLFMENDKMILKNINSDTNIGVIDMLQDFFMIENYTFTESSIKKSGNISASGGSKSTTTVVGENGELSEVSVPNPSVGGSKGGYRTFDANTGQEITDMVVLETTMKKNQVGISNNAIVNRQYFNQQTSINFPTPQGISANKGFNTFVDGVLLGYSNTENGGNGVISIDNTSATGSSSDPTKAANQVQSAVRKQRKLEVTAEITMFWKKGYRVGQKVKLVNFQEQINKTYYIISINDKVTSTVKMTLSLSVHLPEKDIDSSPKSASSINANGEVVGIDNTTNPVSTDGTTPQEGTRLFDANSGKELRTHINTGIMPPNKYTKLKY